MRVRVGSTQYTAVVVCTSGRQASSDTQIASIGALTSRVVHLVTLRVGFYLQDGDHVVGGILSEEGAHGAEDGVQCCFCGYVSQLQDKGDAGFCVGPPPTQTPASAP